jgi:outer membrane receptor for ferrienterochelin and colicin
MRIRIRKLTLGISLAAGVAFAATDPDGMDNFSLADLMNLKLQTGSFLELDLSKSPLSMTIVKREQISLTGARNLSELLEIYVPGFTYSINKWNGITWGMRGVMNDRNSKFIVLVNGHKMNTEARDGFFQETELPGMNEIDHIEALRGPAGLVYGSGAIAGIINIVTRRAESNLTEISSTLGTWGDLQKTTRLLEGTAFRTSANGTKMTVYGAWSASEGRGNMANTIYGAPGWPYPTWEDHNASGGILANGSAQSNPGSWKMGGTFETERIFLQTRVSHQVHNVGGLLPADPWPHTFGTDSVVSGSPKALEWINGLPFSGTDNPYTGGINEDLAKSREYVADNVMAEATWTQSFGEDQLKLKASIDGNTNRTQVADIPGMDQVGKQAELAGFIQETSGEKRYTLGGTYLMKRVPKLQLAGGYEFRFDKIGDDLEGKNYFTLWGNKTTLHKALTPVDYFNNALYIEGMYDVLPKLSLGFGGRWDGHTRTIDNGGTFNGKFATIFIPTSGHSIKAIVQTSTNNPSADNYEPNRYFYDDFGNVNTRPFFQDSPTQHPNSWTQAYLPVTAEELHKLKPERTISYELVSTHDIQLPHGMTAYLSPSISYNQVLDLLAWDQNRFRVDNTGEYQFVSAEIEASVKSQYVDIGFNHTWQLPVGVDVAAAGDSLSKPTHGGTPYYDSVNVQGIWQYYPRVNGQEKYYYNSIFASITQDGRNFLNLPTNISKIYVDLRPTSWLTLHTDTRIIWGYPGRDSSIKALAKGEGYTKKTQVDMLDISNQAIVKWNASAHIAFPDNWVLGIFVYDILSGATVDDGLVNSLRLQYKYDANSNDLYAIDNRQFAVRLDKAF